MCSSPKSSGNAKRIYVNPIPMMSTDERLRYAVCANAAYERRLKLKLLKQAEASKEVLTQQIKIQPETQEYDWKYWLFKASFIEFVSLSYNNSKNLLL